MAYAYVLFPGRHHLLTRFQAAYLERAVAVGVPDPQGEQADRRGAQVVFAVTSADHGTTRRNPLPAHRREAQIERYAALSGMDCLVHPVDDVPQTERFAEYLLAAIAVQEGPELTPSNTVVACSTPAVLALFEALGFRILPVELDQDVQRPWDVLETLVAGQATRAMHPASAQLWDRYGLLEQVRRAHADPLLTDEGELTSKKDYTDNWESEMHEAFCFWGCSDWERAARGAGFEVARGSHGFTNPWLVERRFAPVATLRPAGEREAALPWPHTHLRLVARRPAA